MKDLIFQNEALPLEKVYKLLMDYSNTFYPPLSKTIDIKEYAHKLSDHARFLLCQKDEVTIAFTAYYKNEAAAQLYIPLICVSEQYQRRGLGALMLLHLSELASEGWKSIGLEVVKNNTKGYNFYIKQNFQIEEDRGKKYLMRKDL